MAKITPVRSGQITSVPNSERGVTSWKRLINGVTSHEGVKPLLSVMVPVGDSIHFSVVPNLSVHGATAHTFGLSGGQMMLSVGFLDTVTVFAHQRFTSTFFHLGGGLHSDTQTTVAQYAPNVQQYQYLFATGATSAVNVINTVADLMCSRAVQFRSKYLLTGILGTPFDVTMNISGFGSLTGPVSTLAETNFIGTPAPAQLTDIRQPAFLNAYVKAPSTPFLEVLDEYVLAIGGVDNSFGAVAITTSQALGLSLKFRWSSPDTINEWQPDFVNIPPQWFSGYLTLPSSGLIQDTFIAWGRVYVVMERDVIEVTKVGGATGFSQRALGLNFNLRQLSIRNCVTTPRGVFFVTDDGLFVFNGQTVTDVQRDAEGLFSLHWLAEELGMHFAVPTNFYRRVHLRGMFVPALDSVMWFVTAFDGTPTLPSWNGQPVLNTTPLRTIILVYNYETQTSSVWQSDTGKLWFPMEGAVVGIVEWDVATTTMRTYRLGEKYDYTFKAAPPNVPISWETGLFGTADSMSTMLVTRLFLQYTGAAFDNVIVSANLFSSEKETPDSTIVLGPVSDFTATRWKDIRVNARYVSFTFVGQPAATSGAEMKGVGVSAIATGSRY